MTTTPILYNERTMYQVEFKHIELLINNTKKKEKRKLWELTVILLYQECNTVVVNSITLKVFYNVFYRSIKKNFKLLITVTYLAYT